MKLYLIRHMDNGNYMGYRHRWVSKNSPRTFGRRSDLSNHLNQTIHGDRYVGVSVERLDIITIDLDTMEKNYITMNNYIRGMRSQKVRYA